LIAPGGHGTNRELHRDGGTQKKSEGATFTARSRLYSMLEAGWKLCVLADGFLLSESEC
jgi:hypothetical protein